MDPARIGRVILIAGSTIALCVLVHKFVPSWRASSLFRRRPSHSGSGAKDLIQPFTQQRSVKLRQVAPSLESKIETKIDIIAIHGLDTRSPDTWTWVRDGAKVNWLEHPQMLPTLKDACIFTCDWPADLFEHTDQNQKTIEELARLLLVGIKSRRPVTGNVCDLDDRPIIFIASCLGGVVLMKALVTASEEHLCVKNATRGIVFLATPFQGTSFQNVAEWAEPGLRAWARVQNKSVTNLLKHTLSTTDLDTLVRQFTALCRDSDIIDSVRAFYETGKSSLARKLAPWLPDSMAGEMEIVDLPSAALQFVSNPVPLNRPHILMNKFSGPDDLEYPFVANAIAEVLLTALDGRPITKADVFMRNGRYSLENLKIERLTGELLPMDQCYINLAIVEDHFKNEYRTKATDTTERASPFALESRLKLAPPDKEGLITLPRLFEARKTKGGQDQIPHRILVRGQAGVGKTTLCKKIVHDFVYEKLWKGLFNHVLWVPLRKLKLQERRNIPGYSMHHLLLHEYFSSHREGEDLAKALEDVLEDGKTLFILDGLDEVLDLDGSMFEFIKTLLNQQNAIITSRANAILPTGVRPLDLELDTIGFGSKEVTAYIKNAFTNHERREYDLAKVGKVQDFLQRHQLLQGLVRIPIQLDAFCFTWDGAWSQHIPETMTAVYEIMECNLWKKDLLNLRKVEGLTPHTIRGFPDVDDHINQERNLLEALAFTGMVCNIIDFGQSHRKEISTHFPRPEGYISLDSILGKVSFLRTSDSTMKNVNRTYHFLHLTFQEYFAARYFVRHWKDSKKLKCLALEHRVYEELRPAEFLQKYKYDDRYDIFWRFVAGLIGAEDDKQKIDLFKMIEAEPRDLLGPAHQRLIMHCLSEVSSQSQDMGFAQIRKTLESHLSQWLLFECEFRKASRLACDMDLPESSLMMAFQQATEETRRLLAQSIQDRPRIPSSVTELASIWVAECGPGCLSFAVFDSLRRLRQPLADGLLPAITVGLGDGDWRVREAALEILQNQPTLSEEHLEAIATRLGDDNWDVRKAALRVLRSQPTLSEEHLEAVAIRLGDDDLDVRKAALMVLQIQPTLSEEHLEAVAAWLGDDDSRVREAALEILQSQPTLSEEHLEAIAARLGDDDWNVRDAALEILQSQPTLSEEHLEAIAARLGDDDWDVRKAALEIFQSQPTLSEEHLDAIAAWLGNDNWRVRKAALEVLQSRPTLAEEHLEAVAARLGDDDWNVRDAALEVLQSQPTLSEEHLEAIAARLGDDDWDVRKAALRVLQSQPTLSEEHFEAVAARLGDDNSDVRKAAVMLLLRSLPNNKPCVGVIGSFFQTMLEFAFEEHVTWELTHDTLCISTVLQVYQANDWPNGLTEAIKEVQDKICPDLWRGRC